MSSHQFNFCEDITTIPDATNMRVGFVVSEWNNQITDRLLESAVNTLTANGVSPTSITVRRVPGSFELVFGASQMVKSGRFDAVIAIGCVVRGDTPHFDYICQGATEGLASLNADYNVPVIYGLLTCNTMEQAEDRCGGILGNKGDECAVTALKMIDYRRRFA